MSDTKLSIVPWERQPGEPHKWFVRFEEYRLQGPARTFLSAYNRERELRGVGPGAVSGDWKDAADKWAWNERAEAWDRAEMEERRVEWAARRERWRQQEWEIADKMHTKLLEMLVFPVAEVVREEDGQVTVIEPAKWRVSDIPKIAAVASKLARLATGMATEHTETVEWNPSDFTDEELEQIAKTGDVRSVIDKRKQGIGYIGPAAKSDRSLLASGEPV